MKGGKTDRGHSRFLHYILVNTSSFMPWTLLFSHAGGFFFSTFNLALSHRYCFTLIIQITVVVYPLVSALSLASGGQQKTGVNNSCKHQYGDC